MKASAVCGLGGMAPSAVMTNLLHFRGEFETHIRDKSCSAGVCRGLTASKTKMAGTSHSASVAGRMEA
jgi:hypothetical protein